MKAHLRMSPAAQKGFALQLQKGMQIWFQSGCSVSELICDQLGIPADYLESRIQTIFLNGKVVDKPETRRLQAGDVLTLSAAMPGLAGATLRRGGVLGGFRGGITHDGADCQDDCEWSRLTIKVFNLLIKDLAPVILGRGVVLSQTEAQTLLGSQPSDFWDACLKARVEDQDLKAQEFASLSWLAQGQEVDLTVEFVV